MEFDYLSKYCKFKKSIAVLKRQSEIEAKASKEVFGALEKSKRQELAVLEHYIDSLEAQLKACDQEVHTMKHYKDKDYPKQVVRIAQLKSNVLSEEEKFQVQLCELQRMIAEEEYAREKLVDADFCQLQMTAVHEILLLKQKIPQLKAEIGSLKQQISCALQCLKR
jgi:hypothetical protein